MATENRIADLLCIQAKAGCRELVIHGKKFLLFGATAWTEEALYVVTRAAPYPGLVLTENSMSNAAFLGQFLHGPVKIAPPAAIATLRKARTELKAGA